MKIDLDSDWTCFVSRSPPGGTIIGVIADGRGNTGALVRYAASGLYVLINGNMTTALDQVAVVRAMNSFSHTDT